MSSDCPVCHGKPLPDVVGPDGQILSGVCGVCTPLPQSVVAELDDDQPDQRDDLDE